jgi:hypothetical protein
MQATCSSQAKALRRHVRNSDSARGSTRGSTRELPVAAAEHAPRTLGSAHHEKA